MEEGSSLPWVTAGSNFPWEGMTLKGPESKMGTGMIKPE